MALDIVAGTIGGVAGIVACQPADTVKVRLQTQLKGRSGHAMYTGPLDCIKRIWSIEGPRAFYKGMVAPVVSNAPINAVVFGVERSLSRYFHQHPHGLDPDYQHYVAGFVAGFAQCTFAAPAELIKVRLQVERGSAHPLYHGNYQCARYLYKQDGFRYGLYRGFWITVLRDAPAFACYFWTYDVFKNWMMQKTAKHRGVPVEDCPPLSSWQYMISGGMAGVCSWIVCHPIDVLKSCIQAAPSDLPASERTAMAIARKLYAEEGARFLLRGYWATLARAFPNSAVTFLVYELCVEHMADWEFFAEGDFEDLE